MGSLTKCYVTNMLINLFVLCYNKGDMKVPIIRKVIDVGRSKAVTIPKTWLEYFEKELGEKIKYVTIEVDTELKILPYLPEKEAPTDE